MAIILSLETSTDVCSVALHHKEKLLAEAAIHEPQSHGAQLAVLIDQIMKTAGIHFKDISAVAVTSGPGSYTGLRIGTATAKGLCYGLDIPLIAVGSLELLAFQGSAFNPSNALLCPMIDARRMEVYCLVSDSRLKPVVPVSAVIVEHNSFQELLNDHKMLFFGNGSQKCRAVLHHGNAEFIGDISPLASALGQLAKKKFDNGNFEDLIRFKPFYLKEFVAKKSKSQI